MKLMRRCAECGHPLSRYNPAERCHSCTPAVRTTVTAPPALLLDPVVRRALADWDWATVLRAVARTTGASQTAIATVTGLSQPHVSRLMNGRSREPGIRTVKALCDSLGIPRTLAGLAAATRDDREELATDRRSFISGSMSAAVLTAVPASEAKTARIGLTEVQQLYAAAHELLTLDHLHGADALRGVGVGWLRRADDWLNFATYPLGVGRELQVAYGTLAHVTGWLHYDSNRQAASRHYYREAIGAAQLAGDAELEVRVLAAMSLQSTHVGRPREAVGLAQRARERAARWASPRVEALLLSREAIGWARSGDREASRRAFIQASQVFEPRPHGEDPQWIGFFDEAEFTGLKALALSHLRRHDRAVPLLSRATSLRSAHGMRRNHLWFQTFLAEQRLKLGDIAGASETLGEDLPAIADLGSSRIRRRAAAVCRALTQVNQPKIQEVVRRARQLGVVTTESGACQGVGECQAGAPHV